MKINKNRSAVLLIEFQNQWTERGLYHRLIKRQLKSGNVIANTLTLVEKAREKGAAIIHAPLIIDPYNKKGWLAHLTLGKVFTKGSEKSEITEGFYKKKDIIISGRYAFDAFIGSDLEEQLSDHKIENILFCGFTTDQCVAKTMITAIKKNFNCYLISDCTAAIAKIFQRKIEKSFPGKIFNYREILNMLK